MKIAVFGASGKTGQHVVAQALAAGHQVVALVRTPSKLNVQHPDLTIIQGSVQDSAAVGDTVRGVDAVISVLGPTNNKPEFIISQGTGYILDAMREHGVRRIIISAGAGVRDPQDKPGLLDHLIGFLLSVFSGNVVADMKQAVERVRASDREWTVVRVPMLTDEPAKQSLKIGYLGEGTSPRLSRADMADFMLRQLSDNTYLRKAPVISN